jgi:arginyl-tRNA synthetase
MTESSMTVRGVREHLARRVEQVLDALGAPGSRVDLAPPPDPKMGDLGFPCFALAKALRRPPPKIAEEVAAGLGPDAILARVSTDKAYVNLHLRREALFEIVLREVLAEGARYGARPVGSRPHVMVEYSSPNTNKPLHLGHLRNNVLGCSVGRVLAFAGHRVTTATLVNDRGVHICKSMLAYERWAEGSDPARAGKKGDHLVGELYVRFERALAEEYAAWRGGEAGAARLAEFLASEGGRRAEAAHAKDPGSSPPPEKVFADGFKDTYFNSVSELGGAVRAMLLAWEAEDAPTRALWARLNGWVEDGFQKTYDRLGVGFDLVQKESETYKLGKELVEEGLASGIFRRGEDGAVLFDLTRIGKKGDKVLLRSDGTSVYMTQDLGTAVERHEEHAARRLVYVVGDEQLYHFEVLFGILGLLRPALAAPGACHHLAYGMIRLPEGRMKSREGTVVDADDLMDEMHRLAREETRARSEEGKAHAEGISEEELELRAERIGLAALKYYLLKFTPRKSFEYDPKESIDFLGQTGPYCLFNYARTRSLQRRVGGGAPRFEAAAVARLGTEAETAVLRHIVAFPEVVDRAADALDPSRIAEHLFELAQSFATLFTDKALHPIATCEDEELRRGRLILAAAVGEVLGSGLRLLGIEPLEEM